MKVQNLDVLFEIKYLKSSDRIVPTITRVLPKLLNSAITYKKTVNREVMLRIAIVSPIEIGEWNITSEKLYSLVNTTEIQVLFTCIHPRALVKRSI